jgi:hypothetical protein
LFGKTKQVQQEPLEPKTFPKRVIVDRDLVAVTKFSFF